MRNYNKVLLDSINREISGTDFHCPPPDKAILQDLFREINEYAGTCLCYLAELDAFTISGSGPIIVKYLPKFSSESVRGYLIPKLVLDKVPDCDRIVLQSYLRFKSSNEYIAKPGAPAPSHIYVRYDNAISLLKPKRIKNDLSKLVSNPRDAFYLPFTTRMLASWKIPELKDLFISYSYATEISAHSVGLKECDQSSLPPLSFIRRELRFTAIDCLKYYPSIETFETIKQHACDTDCDIRVAAKETLKYLLKGQGDLSPDPADEG